MLVMLYFDSASTAVGEKEFFYQAVNESIRFFANPSSLHDAGRCAKKELDHYRQLAANVLSTRKEHIIFTSGATESNQIVLSSLLLHSSRRGIILMSACEHSSIYENKRWLIQYGFTVKEIAVDELGRISLDHLAGLLTKDVLMVCCMAVNYQSGAINDISAVSRVVRSYSKEHLSRNIHIHVDAAQMTMDYIYKKIEEWNSDSFAVSSHKIAGPRGVGLLYWNRQPRSFLMGGGQEYGMRSGTENFFGIVGLVKAMIRAANYNDTFRNQKQELFYKAIELAGGSVYHKNFTHIHKSPYLYLVRFSPIPAQVIVRHLSLHGIMVGTNSACSGSNNGRLRSLLAQGISVKEAEQIVRFSYCPWTNLGQLEELLYALPKAMQKLQK